MASDSDAGGERRIALSEREVEVAEIGRALERASTGGTLVIEGPAGIGKTSLMNELEEQARGGGFRLLRATGSELERDFGFGIVRQLLGPMLRSTDDAGSALLLSGPAALAAPVFGIGEAGALEVHSGEASLYGLFWLLAGLADEMPVVLAIDDAHWADAASLRFIRYLCQRLPGMPVLVTLATRPSEPGAQAEILKDLTNALEMPTIRPSLLSQAGTAGVVRAGLGEASAPTEAAFYEATGGNPLLIAELLAELRLSGSGAPVPEQVAAMGPKRIAWSVIERARALDPDAGDLVRAAALLGGGWDTRIVAELAGIEAERAARMIDGLSAASILVADSRLAFVHPLLRTAVYEDIPAAERAGAHSRAAELLARQGAGAEEVAAHLLSSAPGGTNGALQTLDEAAANALARGATESVVAYLRRALGEEMEQTRRADLLHRLGSAEVTLRDPASIGHLQAAIELAGEPRRALSATLELAGVLSTAGMWEETGRAIETGLAEFGGSDLSGVLELEAFRAAYLGYDPASAEKYAEDVPRLLGLVEGRTDFDSSSLRCVLGTIGAFQETSREAITELISPDSLDWRLARDGRESTLVPVAILALLMVDALEEAESAVAVVIEDARARGSLLAMISGVGATAVVNQRRGRLAAAEADLRTAIELLGENELSLMALATFLHFCLETIAEREELNELATVVEALEMPPAFGKTFSGAVVLEVRGAMRMARGEREGALSDLRSAEMIFRPLRTGPRASSWRSRLALALPPESRAEALSLVNEELELAQALESPRAESVSLRVLATLTGGDEALALLRESAAVAIDEPSPLERARALAELGAALRRRGSRSEAREILREAADLAQQCGAQRLESHVLTEMRIAGGRPGNRKVSGPDSLTPSERRVADAAAGGLMNREIAQTLFVSLRTVETHLTNAYRKLEITSRAELARALDERGPPNSS